MTDARRADDPQRCALPGCDAIVVQPVDGGAPARYCSAAHRVTGRKLRYQARQTPAAEQPRPYSEQLLRYSDQLLPYSDQPAMLLSASGRGRSTDSAADAPHPMRIRAQRVSRSARAALRSSGSGLPAAGQTGQAGGAAVGVRRRRQAIAVLSAVSILAAGIQAASTSSTTASSDGLSGSAQPQSEPAPSRADVERALTLVSAQLDLVTQTLAAWNQRHWAGPLPPQVIALMEHQTSLEHLRLALQSRLELHDSMPHVAADLLAADRQVSAINQALSTTPTLGSAEQIDSGRHLAEEHRLWTTRRDDLAALKQTTDRAVAEPLPVVTDRTAVLVQDVNAISDQSPGGPQPNGPTDPQRQPLAVAAPRQGAGDERDPANVGAPPNAEPPSLLYDPDPPADEHRAGTQHDAVGLTEGTETPAVASHGDGDPAEAAAVAQQYLPVAQQFVPGAQPAPAPDPEPTTPGSSSAGSAEDAGPPSFSRPSRRPTFPERQSADHPTESGEPAPAQPDEPAESAESRRPDWATDGFARHKAAAEESTAAERPAQNEHWVGAGR